MAPQVFVEPSTNDRMYGCTVQKPSSSRRRELALRLLRDYWEVSYSVSIIHVTIISLFVVLRRLTLMVRRKSLYQILEPQSGINTTHWALNLALRNIFSGTSKSINRRRKKHYPPMPNSSSIVHATQSFIFLSSFPFLSAINAQRTRVKGSVEWSRHERHFCSLLPYFLLSCFQIFQLCLSFWTSSFDMVLLKKILQEKEKYPKNLPKRLSS